MKSERSNSPVIASHNFTTSATLQKLATVPNQIQNAKAAPKAVVPVVGASMQNQSLVQGHGHGHIGHGQVSAIHNNNVIQSSPISISMLENQIAYSDNSSHSASMYTGRNHASSVRKLKQAQEFQHDSASNSNPNLNDCSHIVVPRRPSPHQISAHPLPFSAVPNPAYPMYNSQMNPSPSPIDASTSRSLTKSNHVAYSSVIQRTAMPSNWDGQSSLQAPNIYNQTPAQITKLHQISPVQQSIDSQRNNHFDSSQSASANLNHSSLTGHEFTNSQQSSANEQFALNQQRQRQALQNEPIKIKDEPIKSRPGRKKKVSDRTTDSTETLCSSAPSTRSEYYTSERVPPPAHVPNPPSSNGSPNYNFHSFHSHNSTMISHPSHHTHHTISHPYFPSFSMPLGVSDYSTDLNLNSISTVANNPYNDSLGTPSVSSNYSPTASEIREDEPPKVVVPNIEEELGFLAENSRSGSIQQTSAQIQHPATAPNHLTLLGATNNVLQSHHNQSNQQQTHLQHSSHHGSQGANNSQSSSSNQMSQQKTPLTDKKFPTPTGPGSGFMASYLKFLQGERDTSPPPVNRGSAGGRKTWSRSTNQTVTQVSPSAANQTTNTKNQMSNGINVHNNMMNASNAYDRKRTAANSNIDDDDDTSDSSSNKQSTNKNSKKQSMQNIVERAPQVPINATKKARTTQSNHNNSLLSSQQSSNALSLQQNNPHALQQNPQLLMQQHASSAHQLVAGTSQILSQQQMYYPQDEGTSSFSSYFDYLRRQKW